MRTSGSHADHWRRLLFRPPAVRNHRITVRVAPDSAGWFGATKQIINFAVLSIIVIGAA
jgi:hypothetical protein